MILYANATIQRIVSQTEFWGEYGVPNPDAGYVVARFVHPNTGNTIKRNVGIKRGLKRLYKGQVIRIRINTAVPLPLRNWVLDN